MEPAAAQQNSSLLEKIHFPYYTGQLWMTKIISLMQTKIELCHGISTDMWKLKVNTHIVTKHSYQCFSRGFSYLEGKITFICVFRFYLRYCSFKIFSAHKTWGYDITLSNSYLE